MRRNGGFTLLEVLIAFTIAALATAVLLQGALGGLRSAGIAARYEEAVARARSHVAALEASLVAGDTQGDDGGGYHWHVRVAPVASTVVGTDVIGGLPALRATLYSVQVAISWQEEGHTRSVELDTKRLGATPPAAGGQ